MAESVAAMDGVWQSSPMAVLRVWREPGGLRVEPNPAAREWALLHGLQDGLWLAVAQAAAGAVPANAAPAHGAMDGITPAANRPSFDIDLPAGAAPCGLHCRWVPSPDSGALLWVWPLEMGAQRADRERTDALAARARLVAEVIGVGFWSYDGDTGIALWDEQLHRIHGRPVALGAPAGGDWVGDVVHPDDRAWMQALQDRTQAEWAPITDAMFRLPDVNEQAKENAKEHAKEHPADNAEGAASGSERWVQTWTRRVVRDGRRLAFGMHLDVSDRQRTQAELDRVRDRQQFAINAAEIGVWERTPAGKVVYWNAAMYRLRGLDPDDPRPCDDLLALTSHPSDHARMLVSTRSHLNSSEPFRLEYRVRGGDGTWHWLATQGRTLRDANGRVLGSAGVNIDVTERKRADALLQEKQRAEQASRDKSALMARLSHELRTPMNAVLGFAQLLDDDLLEPPTERQRARLQRIRDAGSQLMTMIDDVLDLASLDTETAPTDAALVVADEVVHEVAGLLAPLAARHGQRVRTGALCAGARVNADRRRLVQALAQLAAQAIRERDEPGSVEIGVSLRATARGDEVVFSVCGNSNRNGNGNGNGLAPATLASLFEPVADMPATGHDPGGLFGLSLSRRVVETLGGTLVVDAGQGAGVSVCLPAASHDPGPAPTAATTPPLVVLCVEDNPVNMLLVHELLALRPGLQMLSAVDGQSGIAMGLQGRPHIALLDLQLPDLNGVDVLRRLRAEPTLAHCSFVALSANAMPADIDMAMAAGFDEYWTKPINFDHFLAGIDRLAARAARLAPSPAGG